jgi:16S rRNA processing protein RimM
MKPEGLLIVGRIGRPHGVRGDMYLDLLSDREERVAPGAQLWCRDQSSKDQSSRDRLLVVAKSRRAMDRWVVSFEGITDRNEAAHLTSLEVMAEPLLDVDDALWVHDLIGAEVVEVDGTRRGRCISVIDNPAADLLELASGALVPVTFVESVVDGIITVDVPDGLFALNEPDPASSAPVVDESAPDE